MQHLNNSGQQLLQSITAGQTPGVSSAAPIDSTKYFLPEHFTPLFYTPLYAQLTEPQRRRYNQLHACYSHEQIMFFECTMAPHILPALLQRPLAASLTARVHDFLAEEQRHTQMFRDLNRRCLPQVYARQDFYFLQVPWMVTRLLACAAQRPGLFACLVWIMLLEEERAVMLGREVLRCQASLEPHVVAVHRLHLRDEMGHVRCDEALLDDLWPALPRYLRRANATLLRWLLGEFFVVPKRSNMRVITELAREFPALQKRLPQYRSALRALQYCQAWHVALYSRAIVPKTFARFDACSEMHALRRVLHGYIPAAPHRSSTHG